MIKSLKHFATLLDSYYALGYKRVIQKEYDEIEDFFMILTFSEIMGVSNPYEFYMLELIPDLMPKFHQWHTKCGLEKSPFDYFPCSCC